MKKKLHYLIFNVLLFSFFFGFGQKRFSFTDFDYPEVSFSMGASNQQSYFIPVDTFTLETGSVLSLDFEASGVLDYEHSFITVKIGGVPTFTKHFNTNGMLSFKIELPSRLVTSGFFRIDIISSLQTTYDLCEKVNTDALWIKRLPSSYVLLNIDEDGKLNRVPSNISEFIPVANKIVLPNKPDIKTVALASYIQFFFKKEFEIQLDVAHFNDTIQNVWDRSIILSKLKNMPKTVIRELAEVNFSEDQGLVFMGSIAEPETINIDISSRRSLVITGNDDTSLEKAASFMLSKNMLKSAFSKWVIVNEAIKLNRSGLPINQERISLREFTEVEMLEGIGRLSQEISIPRSYFGSHLKEMQLKLHTVYRPVGEKEQAFINVYFDGALKHSQALGQKGNFNTLINFDHLGIKNINTLKIEYYYIPEGGLCVKNPPLFYAETDFNQSYISGISYSDNLKPNFFYFPENFNDKSTRIYIGEIQKNTPVNALSKLFDIINSGNTREKKYIYPMIFPLSEMKPDSKGHNRIILSGDLENFEDNFNNTGYLNVQNSRFNYREEDGENYFNVSYDEKNLIGFNQIFSNGEDLVMYMYSPSNSPLIFNRLFEGMKDDNLMNTGSLILANPNKYYFFELDRASTMIEQEELAKGFNGYWDKYGIFLVFALFILMIVTLIYIYQKSQDSKKAVKNEE